MTPESLPAAELLWDLKSPCADCPFLRSSPPHHGVARGIPQVIFSIDAGTFAHTCHKTDNRPSCDGPRNFDGPTRHCAGAVLMLLKTGQGKDLQLPLLQAAEQGKLDLAEMTARAKASPNVFTLRGFLVFYAQWAQRKLEQAEAAERRRKYPRRKQKVKHGR
jgi:hypothetical protein